MTAREHRENADRIRAAYATNNKPAAFDHLLPRLAAIHDKIADTLDGKNTDSILSTDTIESWANSMHRRLMGVTPRPRLITKWEVWTQTLKDE
jgi:hypothetical protein